MPRVVLQVHLRLDLQVKEHTMADEQVFHAGVFMPQLHFRQVLLSQLPGRLSMRQQSSPCRNL